MIAKLCFVALFSVAFAQVGDFLHGSGSLGREVFTDEDIMKILKKQAVSKVSQTSNGIKYAKSEYENAIIEPLESLKEECDKQRDTVEEAVLDAVFTGMKNNKDLKSFQCISDKAHEIYLKLDGFKNQILNDSKLKVQKAIDRLSSFGLILAEFTDYVEDLFQTKMEELKKAKSDYERKMIVKSFMEKTTHLETVLENFSKQMAAAADAFIHEYGQYALATKNAVTKTSREGIEAIKKCVA